MYIYIETLHFHQKNSLL